MFVQQNQTVTSSHNNSENNPKMPAEANWPDWERDMYKYLLHSMDGATCHRHGTVNDSDLDSVTLKAYKVKDCSRNRGSDDCIWDPNHFFLLPVLRLAIAEVTKEKKEEFCAKNIR